MTEKTGPVLQDHKRKNKRLIPPLLAVMGDKHSPYSWARQLVPELIWIGMLQQGMGIKNITKRISILDGKMQWNDTKLSQGMNVTILIPLVNLTLK